MIDRHTAFILNNITSKNIYLPPTIASINNSLVSGYKNNIQETLNSMAHEFDNHNQNIGFAVGKVLRRGVEMVHRVYSNITSVLRIAFRGFLNVSWRR